MLQGLSYILIVVQILPAMEGISPDFSHSECPSSENTCGSSGCPIPRVRYDYNFNVSDKVESVYWMYSLKIWFHDVISFWVVTTEELYLKT